MKDNVIAEGTKNLYNYTFLHCILYCVLHIVYLAGSLLINSS